MRRQGESIAIVQSGGSAFWPAVSRFTWPFLLLFAAGGSVAVRHRSNRVTMLLLAAIGAQTAALLVVWRVSGADSPYMALKMPHLAIYPMAALGGLALSAAWGLLAARGSFVPDGMAEEALGRRRGVGGVATVLAWTAQHCRAIPQPAPAITEDLYRAGLWAGTCNPTASVSPPGFDILLAHLAVLGNPARSQPTTPETPCQVSAT
jgi:hypothetical protein